MTETVIVDSIEDVMKLIAEQNRNENIGRLRGSCIRSRTDCPRPSQDTIS